MSGFEIGNLRPSLLARRPVALLLVVSIGFVWITQLASLLAGVDVLPAKLAGLLLMLCGATWITARLEGRVGVRRLYAGLTRWRLGRRYLLLVAAMPLTTLALAAATGTLHSPKDGWLPVVLVYLGLLLLGAITGNLWEETVWSGFVQGRLMSARGLLVGSLLTAVPFFLIHVPLAFEVNGLSGTTWRDAGIDWVLLLAAPFQRYLIGTPPSARATRRAWWHPRHRRSRRSPGDGGQRPSTAAHGPGHVNEECP